MTPVTVRSAIELANSIRSGELMATDVVEAHIELHRRWAPTINAIVADRFDAARAEAAAADRAVAAGAAGAPGSNGETSLPLLGVPFTVKESIALRGMPNSAGLVARREHRAGETAPSAQRLIDAGAIPLGVTNTSELTLWIESENRLYGRTSTPYDRSRTAGGSSGGEGAAVGCGGSPFGLASDIAGSIRIPALFCGVFAHKPSPGVVPNTGSFPPTLGESGRLLQSGPLARRASDLMPLLRILAGPDGRDEYVREVSLGDPGAVSLHGLRVVTVEDSSRRPMAAELRDARERAVGALIAAGASARTVNLRSWQRALLPYLATLQGGAGGQTTAGLLAAEGEAEPSLRDLLRRGGPHTRPTRIALAAERLGESTAARGRLLGAARDLAAELTAAVGDGVLLHPAYHGLAPRHGRTLGRPWLIVPAAVFNLAGLPVTEAPLGLSAAGLPVGMQVAAGPDRDHVSIAVALELERVFGGWVPPRPPAARAPIGGRPRRRRRGRLS
jgi:fatty acid amide hydrolase 2